MCYAAKHYVKISGRKFTPGEIIDIPITEEKLERLLRLKAIAPISSNVLSCATSDDAGGDEADGMVEVVSPPEEFATDSVPQEPSDQEEYAEANDVEVQAPEIDVMDGIVSAAEAVPKKEPAKKITSKGRKKT